MQELQDVKLLSAIIRAKLANGMCHNYYGEPPWPNDLLYIFPLVISEPSKSSMIRETADPFAIPL